MALLSVIWSAYNTPPPLGNPKPMRDALKEERLTAWDLKALSLVALHMNPKSIDWLNILFQRYPGHVIEFSVYEQNWGTLAGFNTVFWEVRNY